MFETLLFEIVNGKALITLNRPDVYNAFNDLLRKELLDALKEAEKNPAVRVVIITGAGKAFCSGQDLKEVMSNPNRNISESLHKGYNPIIRLMNSAASAGVKRKSVARRSVSWLRTRKRARGRDGSSRVAMTRCICGGGGSIRKERA